MSSFPIRRIAIIGAGPTGIAFAKHLLAERSFDTVDVFEQRKNVGGIWNLSLNEHSKHVPVPQTNPNYGTDTALEFESPLYDYLETNIPKTLMAYSDFPFANSLPLFPGHKDVLTYLEEYAEPVKHLIRFETQVTIVQPLPVNEMSGDRLAQRWNLVAKDLTSGVTRYRTYDAIVVAVGHYTVPHIPDIKGIADFNQKYPNVIMHSKAYRRPEDFRNEKVLVIGNSASGLDISAQIATCAEQPVYLASRSASQLAPNGSGPTWRTDVAEIEEFLVDDAGPAVRTKEGQVISGLSKIVFATGYYYSYPFLTSAPRASAASTNSRSPSASTVSSETESNDSDRSSNSRDHKSLHDLITSGFRTHDVYKHFLHMHNPTLALPVLNLKIIPFPLAENQATVIARVWSGRLELPALEAMKQWEQDEEKRLLQAHRLRPAPDTASGDSVASGTCSKDANKYEGGFHTLVYPEDAAQINSLYAWAVSAKPREGLDNDGIGKLGGQWDEERVWLRGQFPNIKAAFASHGDKRHGVTSLEELGPDWQDGFEEWKQKTSEKEQHELFRKAAVEGYD